MPPRKELCRNFQRGSCQYGDRCKFLHVVPQQSKPNSFGFGAQNQQQKPNPFGFGAQNQQSKPNPFGFGAQNQQQKPNPFGFGVQNAQQRVANDFGSKQNQFKAFENKWTRANSNNSSTAPRRAVNQAPAPVHECTEPESCKREIVGDLENERPMWKLTSYGHRKNGPCDIVGDVSYEELRAAAYDDAKRGLSMESIVERERNLLLAKLAEFESLARNSKVAQSNPALNSQNPFTRGNPDVTATSQSSSAPSVSSFSQLGTSVNAGSATQPSIFFGQPNPFQNPSEGPPSNNPFGQPNAFQNMGLRSGFGLNNTTFGNEGAPASKITPTTAQSPFTPISASLGMSASGAERNPFSNSSSGPNTALSAGSQSTVNSQLMNVIQIGDSDGGDSIWLKDKWNIGEIPEEAPPDKYIFEWNGFDLLKNPSSKD